MKIETIYDHNPTKKELDIITPVSPELAQKLSKESSYRDIYMLYSIRGDEIKMRKYYKLLSPYNRRSFEMQDDIDFKF